MVGAAFSQDYLSTIIAAHKSAKAVEAIVNYEDEFNKLVSTLDPNITAILGSYMLAEKTPGQFVLKRGKWEDYDISLKAVLDKHLYGVTLRNVGVDRRLTPELPKNPTSQTRDR